MKSRFLFFWHIFRLRSGLIIFHLWQEWPFSDYFQEEQYGTKLSKEKIMNIEAD
jgi:hypothetical protein